MKTDNIPLVSVVLLTKNGGEVLIESLQEIRDQQFARPCEVIIVDSGSTDGTLEKIKACADQFAQIPSDQFNFGLTRDLGFSLAKGQFIATLSQDAIPANRRWLKNLVEPFQHNDSLAAVSGRTLMNDGVREFFWSRIGFYYFTSDFKKWIEQTGGKSLSNVNACYRKDAWEKINFGSCEMGEDQRFVRRALALGFEIGEAPHATVYHGHNYTLGSLFLRSFNEAICFRDLGIHYGIAHLFRDIIGPKKYLRLLNGLVRGDVRNPAEFIFPFVKPVYTYMGHKSKKGYRA